MAKKKKKVKKKEVKKIEKEEVSSYTLDTALKSSKKTESALQGLLRAFSEDNGYVTSKEEEKPSFSKKDLAQFLEKDLVQFFEKVFQDYNDRYGMWENSVSSILAILRKMRKITKKNTEDLVNSINTLHEKIQFNLGQFKIKRDEVEKLTDVDIETMSSEFKKVLGLLELQIKEYQLKRLADDYVHQQKPIQ